jgi:hypothetical protein
MNYQYSNKRMSRKLLKGGEPTLASNLADAKNVATSLANNIVADGIYSVADRLGIDPKKPASETVAQVGNSMENVVNALNSPEGEKLKENASELLSESIDIVKPSIEKVENILEDGVTKLTKTGTSAAVTLFNELPPIFALTEASKLGTAVVQAGTAVADLITTGATAKKQLEPQRNEAYSLIQELARLSRNINNGVSGAINTVKSYNNEYRDNIVKRELDKPNQEQEQQMNDIIQGGGANNVLKKYRQQAKLIGGRIKQSQLDFFTSHVKSSKIVKSRRPKRRTKRHSL